MIPLTSCPSLSTPLTPRLTAAPRFMLVLSVSIGAGLPKGASASGGALFGSRSFALSSSYVP